jgi:hypothetical protein
VAIFTIFALLDTITAVPFSQLYQLFSVTIVDPESLSVRVTTVRALGRIVEHLEAEEKPEVVRGFIFFFSTRTLSLMRLFCAFQKGFQDLFPGILAVTAQSVEANDADSVKYCFEVIESLAYSVCHVVNFLFFR